MWRELGRAVRTWCAMNVMGPAFLCRATQLDYGSTVVLEQTVNPFVSWVSAYIPSMN
jgi:hypothetical protein